MKKILDVINRKRIERLNPSSPPKEDTAFIIYFEFLKDTQHMSGINRWRRAQEIGGSLRGDVSVRFMELYLDNEE